MAYVERYVSALAGGGGDGSSGTPWTLAEAIAAYAAGDRVNVKADGTYDAAWVFATDATSTSRASFRGYTSTIGDHGRPTIQNSSGAITASIKWVTFEDINFIGVATSTSYAFTSTNARGTKFMRCTFTNTTADSGRGVNSQYSTFYECIITAYSYAILLNSSLIIDSKINSCAYLSNTATVEQCLILAGGDTSLPGVYVNALSNYQTVLGNTIKGFATGVYVNNITDGVYTVPICNNLIANITGWGISNAATDTGVMIVRNNAFYSCSSGQVTGIGNDPVRNSITLSADPFTNAAGGDYTLNNTANGGAACRGVGAPTDLGLTGSQNNWLDVGALQVEPSAGGGGPDYPDPLIIGA